jgi:hypothetical protein
MELEAGRDTRAAERAAVGAEGAAGRKASGARRGRFFFLLAALGILLYFANIAVGLGAVKLGWKVARLSDVWEFLIVVLSMIFFVAGLLAVEGQRPDEPRRY